MFKKMFATVVAVVLSVGFVGASYALDLGNNITIFDNREENSPFHLGIGQGREDQEVEPGAAPGQKWDLEGAFLQGAELSLVGGFPFTGQVDGVTGGDIFLAVGEAPSFGTQYSNGGNQQITNTFGYDYVLDMDYAAGTYNIVKIDSSAVLLNSTYANYSTSDPWRYVSGGTIIGSGTMQYQAQAFSDAQSGFQGDSYYGNSHNLLTGINLGFLGMNTEFWMHYTIQCGNDDLMGKGVVTPEPTTLLLLGSGLLGVFAFGRKRLSK